MLVGDGVALWDCDVRFDLFWRRDGRSDTTIWSATNHFTAPPLGLERYAAVPFDATPFGEAVPADAGDQLVLHIVVEAAAGEPAYQPNGAGAIGQGRTPSLTLPQPP